MKTDKIYGILSDNGFKLTTDSRNVKPGDVFFALRGDNFNGNRYAAGALDKGASLAVIDDPEYSSAGTLLVDDVLYELQAVAARHRMGMDFPVLAVTGSNGKTTTKEIMARILAEKYKVHYTRGNLNNHIGVPLTILSCPPETEFMIVEMGANHKGEIKQLCNIARPDYGIITNVGKAHLEGFGSLQGIIEAKSELYDHIRSVNGYVFFNENDQLLRDVVEKKRINAVPYSKPGNHSLIIHEVSAGPPLKLTAGIDGQKYTIGTKLFGIYNIENLVASMATGLYFGVLPQCLKEAAEAYAPVNNRSQILRTAKNTLVCDSYNANPVSMEKSIDSFIEGKEQGLMMILGDMFELGEYEIAEHEKILQKLALIEGAEIIVVGKVFHSLAAKYKILSFPSRDELAEYLRATPAEGKLILVKASRAIGLEQIYDLM